MNAELIAYKNKVTEVFTIGIDVLNVSRSLKNISLDLKLLAINGIIQAARIGDGQGQSLVALSGFLSSLPAQISPELNDLENLTANLSSQITACLNTVRRFMLYSLGLELFLKQQQSKESEKFENRINIYKALDLERIEYNPILDSFDSILKSNIIFLAKNNLKLIQELNDLLFATKTIIIQSRNKIERVRRNRFIANYTGSNISIESSYLLKSQQNFGDLVNNIKNMVNVLNERLDIILDKINDSENFLTKLIKSGIIR